MGASHVGSNPTLSGFFPNESDNHESWYYRAACSRQIHGFQCLDWWKRGSSCVFRIEQGDANMGVVPVPDVRLTWLNQLYKPKKLTNATVEIVDVAGMLPGQSQKDGLSPQLMTHLRQVDALVHVVRAFYRSIRAACVRLR